MGQAGFAIVQQHYTWSSVANAIAGVLMPGGAAAKQGEQTLESVAAD